ncbi:MAG: hypothetical protein ONB05_07060, partial [candidate division KSB1 bacterium]|nr:hypothetical protein [candidate division KSB1 bacterium]
LTDLGFSTGNDFVVLQPYFIISGNLLLASNATDTLIFTVTTTGQAVGPCTVTAHIFAIEDNSGDTLAVSKNTQIVIEEPAALRIQSVVNRARNAPHVNTNQNFAIQVRVAMVGGLYTDEADSVKVLLTANSTSIGSIILPWVSWESPRDTVFQVTAPDTMDSALVFTAHILRAKARNTGALIPDTLLLPAVDDTALAIVEWPAKLSIVQLIAPDTVQARQINPWSIGLIVKNEGSAGLTLKQPTPQDIILKIGDTVQPDYFIIAPDSLNGGGLTLKARQEDTLVYIVKATGEQGGLATIEAHLTAIDENSGSLVDDSIIEDIFVETSAAIRIESTLPICHNYEEEVGLVNVGRDFRVRVWVTNAGREQVDKVMVVLNTEDEAHVTFPDTIIIDFIAPQSKGLAEFPVLAKALDNRVEFVASVVSAKGHNSGLQVPIQTPIDATAVVRIQTPANLELRAQTTNFDSVFTRDQTFEVLAQVLNKGEAQVDHSGKLALFLPPGYYFDDPIDSASTSDTVNFRVGEWVNWTIHTPAQASGPDTIRLALIQIPKDKNIDSAAVVSVDSAWLVVWTDSTQLTVTASIIEPTGATDGIVSTEQDFKVRANVKFSSNLENPQLRLVLPSGGGYQIVGGDSTQKVTGGPVFWTVKAPRSNSPKAYLKLQATAIEKGSQHLKTAEHSLSIETVERANLNLTAWVSDPPVSAGATTVSLSFNQKFKISARVINSGKAGVSAPTQLRIDPGATGVTIQDDILRTIEVGTLVTWTLQAPNFVTSLAPITISMDSIPADENTNEKAFKTVTTVTIQVATVETGTVSVDSVWIASPLGAIDGLLSTDQEFRIKARVSWVRCQNIRAEIQLPDGSGFYNVGDDSRYFVNTTSSGEGTVDWIVRAPVDALSRQEISITAHGYDAYNTTLEVHSSPATVTVSVVQKAKCALQAVIFWPPSAVERIVSVGQTFQIKAYLTNSGTAGIKNNYSAELTAPHGYTLSSNSIQSVSPADTIKWTLRAPEQPAEVRQIKIRVVEKPRDVNSDTSAYFTEDTREISIETKENSLIIATLPSTTPAAIAHGDRGIPMLRLLFRNSGGVPNNILLRKLAVKLKNRKGELLPSPSQAISRIAAVKSSNPEVIYGEVTALTDQNPIEIVFSPERPIRPALPDSINIIVDVAPSASVSNFQVVIDSSSCIDAIEEYSGKPIALKDADGNPSSVLNLVSEISEVMKAELSASFCNYPNPFGRPDRAVTNIIYYLKQDSDVEIKIYSLTGELVWSQTYSASEPHGRAGMHDWDQLGRPPIVWDGKNEWHTTVLNGVYLAILKTNHGETAITKIAVLK